MEVRLVDRDDPGVAAILQDRGLPVRFDPEHADLVLLGLEEHVPVAFISGFVWNGQPILHQMAVRPGFAQKGRLRALGDAFLAHVAEHGFPYVLIPVDSRHPLAPHHRALLSAWRAVPYHVSPPFEWYVRYSEMAHG